jgi:NAD(P)H-dependent FMN reductase
VQAQSRVAMDSQLTIPVIYGSVRTERQGIKFARFVLKQLEERGINAILVDPMERQFPLLDRMYKEFPPGEAPALMSDLAALLKKADGFIVVSGEYNNGIPPALKNMMDHFLEEYFWRPAGIACYSGGRWGGVRGAMQLRMTLAEMGMVTIPSLLPMARVGEAFSDDGTPVDKNTISFSKQFFDEFLWYVEALCAERRKGVPY